MIGADLLRYNKDQLYLAKDYETEGVNLYYSRPWQVSYILFNLDKIIDRQTYYIWFNDLKVSKGAARVTRFNYEYYKSVAINPNQVLEKLDKYIYDPNIISITHNFFHFDGIMHRNLRRACNKPNDLSYFSRALDTWALSKAFNDNIIPDRENLEKWQYQVLSKKTEKGTTTLSAMAKKLEIEVDENLLHDADFDTYLLMQIFKQLLWKVEI